MVFPRLPFVESWRRARRRGRASGPEVVVVGAGLGGLVTAALLAERYQVAIVERNPFAGGYASAVRYGDTAFDFGAQDIAILGREGMRTIRRLGLLPRLRRIRPHAVSIYPEHRFVWGAEGPAATSDYLKAQFPTQRKALDRYFAAVRQVYRELDRYFTPAKFRPEVGISAGLDRYRTLTAEQLLREFFSDDILISLLGSYCLFYQGLPIHTLSALHFIGLQESYFDNGAFYAEGGIGALSEALVARVRSLGGTLELGCGVTGVEVADARVQGVTLADGRRLGARAIVANVDPRLVGAWLGVQDGVRLPTGGGPRADHLSRCQLLATLADDAPALPFVTFFASTYDKAQEYQGFVDGEPLSIRMFCPPVQPRTLSVALPAPYLPWRAAFDRGPEIYASAKEAMMGRVLALVLRAYPALAGKLQPIDLLTPVEVAARGGNSAGSLYGADAIPDQTGLPRSLLVPAVRGLFFAGQWAAPGGSATLVLRGAALTASATHTFLKGAT